MRVTIKGRIPDGSTDPVWNGQEIIEEPREYLTLDDLQFFDESGQEILLNKGDIFDVRLSKVNRHMGRALTLEVGMVFSVSNIEINDVPLIITNDTNSVTAGRR